MEQLKANMNSVRDAQSKRSDKSWRETVTLLVGKTALHFRTEISDADIEIYLDGLRGSDIERVSKAFERCIKECQFMPKLRDIFDRMPEEKPKPNAINAKIMKQWTEPYSQTHVIRYFETEHGDSYARIEPK